MESISEIYRIGYGPSSSHTMGPKKAAETFLSQQPDADHYKVTLFGSLAATGKGHLTDKALINTFSPFPIEIDWEPSVFLPFHPNAMTFEAFDSENRQLAEWTAYSIGGGAIVDEKSSLQPRKEIIYEHQKMNEILEWCFKNGASFWEYAEAHEKEEFWDYLYQVWKVMKSAVVRGIEHEGVLPGIIHLPRKASAYYIKAKSYRGSMKRRGLAFSYALAVAEENASGGKIVTAPTCGSSGVLPAVLYVLQETHDFSEQKIIRALATAGLIGNLVKKNASISGAQVGCQGEIGTACAMASGAAAQLFGGTPYQIEYAAEMGLEHHLGLTCDPVAGLVQIPCIERNAFAASRALDACSFAMLSDGKHRISFDRIVNVMNQTGHDLPSIYKETSEGGLALSKASFYKKNETNP